MNFAVAVLSYNHPNITSECLKSVIEVVPSSLLTLTHNGSLSQHRMKLLEEFPKINHISLEENRGYSGGCNFTLMTLFKKYEWVYFLTNDVTLLSLGDLPDIPGLYAPKIWRRKIGVVDSIGGAFIPHEKKLYHLKTGEELKTLPATHLSYVPGTAFLLHRSVFETTSGMDESLHTYWEDVDFSQRVKAQGFPIKPILNFELIHKVGKTCHKDPFYTNHLFKRNREIISEKYSLL